MSPTGISQEEYLEGNISLLRNPIIASVLYRLKIIEMFATGIKRIKASYASEIVKPRFEFTNNSIKITLPALDAGTLELSKNQQTIYNILIRNTAMTRLALDEQTGFEKTKTIRILNSLMDKGIVEKYGVGPSTKYRLVR